MSAETQAERTRAVIEQTLGAHEWQRTVIRNGPGMRAAVERSSLGTPEAQAARSSVSDEQARRIVQRAEEIAAEQAQTTYKLTDDERAQVCSAWRCDGSADDESRCTDALNTVNQILASRSAGDRDAHQALARVRALLDHWDADPQSLSGIKNAADCVRYDLRRALGDADDQHDRSGT